MKETRFLADSKIVKILDILTKLTDYSSNGIPIIVEGKKDENALKVLGVSGRIVRIRQRGKRLFELAEELSQYKTVIILTDFDKEGEELALELSKHLHSWGVQTIMRGKVRSAISWATRQIEGLSKVSGLREHLNDKQFIGNSS